MSFCLILCSLVVVQSERIGNAAKWAHEFGLEVEEDDIPLLRYKIKLQALFNQANSSPNSTTSQLATYTLVDQYILLQAACVDSLDVITIRTFPILENFYYHCLK